MQNIRSQGISLLAGKFMCWQSLAGRGSLKPLLDSIAFIQEKEKRVFSASAVRFRSISWEICQQASLLGATTDRVWRDM